MSKSTSDGVNDPKEKPLEGLARSATDLDRSQWLERLREDMCQRWERGERILARTYLEQFPELHANQEGALDLIYQEILLREEHGESPQMEEYLKAYPQYCTQIQRQFSVHQGLVAKSSDSPPRLTQVRAESAQSRSETGKTQTKPAQCPLVLPGYEMLGILGRGGMGVVYKARHIGLNRLVALKMILGSQHQDAASIARFHAEAEVIARLKHPNIVQIYDIGEAEGQPFFSLEFVEGGSLDKKLAGNPQPAALAAELIEVLARAVHAAHEAGIVHRDLKPANVLLAVPVQLRDGDTQQSAAASPSALSKAKESNCSLLEKHFGVPKVTDFGLAKRLEAETGQTGSGAIVGTPSYMAPEQAEGRVKDISPATDVYALGAIMYEVLTGRPPFKGETTWDTVLQVINDDPLPPSRLQPKVPRDLEIICLKSLSKNPGRRYGSALELAEDLRRYQVHEPIVARAAGWLERSRKWVLRNPWKATGVGLIVVLLLVVIGGFIWHDFSLQIEVARARADESRAKERERLAKVETEIRQRMSQAEAIFQAGDWSAWPTAKVHLSTALAMAITEPELAGLKQEIETRMANGNRFDRFTQLREEALFHATLFTGMDAAANLEKTRAAATQAIQLFGVALDSDTSPGIAGVLNQGQQAAITWGCYELLLVLADATAYPLPQQTAEQRRAGASKAIRVLDRAAQLGLKTRAWHLRLARYLEQRNDEGDPKRAAEERAAGGKIVPATAQDWFLSGEDAAKRGTLTDAIHDFEQALHQQADHYWAQYFLAVCHLRLNRPGEAKLGLTMCLARQPDFRWTYLLRGYAHGELEEFAQAEADFQHVLDRQPTPTAKYAVYANRGVMRIRQKKFDDAASDLQKAIKIRPDSFPAYVSLAEAYHNQDKLDEAIRELDKAVERGGKQSSVYRFRARLHEKRPNLDAALADYEQAIAHGSAGTRSLALLEDHIARGKIYHRQKQYALAVEAYDAAMRLRLDYPTAHRLRAESLLMLNRVQEAILSLDIYVQTAKPTAEVYRARGLARAKVGNHAGALEDYTVSLNLEADSATYAHRGWAYLLIHDAPKLGLSDFEQALQLGPANCDLFLGRGTAKVMLGDHRSAVADAEQALKEHTNATQPLYKTARIYALAFGKAEPEVEKGGLGIARLRGEYQDRALELLRKALTTMPDDQRAGFFRNNVLKDKAFMPIGRSPGFVKLAAEQLKLGK